MWSDEEYLKSSVSRSRLVPTEEGRVAAAAADVSTLVKRLACTKLVKVMNVH